MSYALRSSVVGPVLDGGVLSMALVVSGCSPAPAARSTEPVVSVVLPAAVTTAGPAPGAPPSPWRIGAFLSLSGEDAELGLETKEGMDLAVEELNAHGGVKGRPLAVVYEDDGSNPLKAAEAVLRLIDRESVVALLGETTSARSKAGAIVANRRGVPIITPSATHPSLTKVGPFVFRACFDDDAQGRGAARFVVGDAGKKRIGVLFASDDIYSSTLASAFEGEATRLGATIVAEQRFVQSERDLTAQLTALRRSGAEAIYAPVYFTAMPAIVKKASELGIRGDRFVGGDGWATDDLLRETGDALEGARFTDHWVSDAPGPVSRAFVQSYRQRFQHGPSSLAAMGYDAVELLADAIGRARETTHDAIRQALQETHGFVGASGTIASMGADREPAKDIVVVRIEDRRFQYETSVRGGP